jgi:hypothetical protein
MRIWLAGLALALSATACGPSLDQTPAEGANARGPAPEAAPPKGAAGLIFGAAPSDVKKACEGAGKTWSSNNNESGICSGPAADIGFNPKVRVDFCYKKSCIISLEGRPESNQLATFNDVKQRIAKEYGTPALMPTKGIPEKCRQGEQFAQCLEADGLSLMYRWDWPSREQIILTIGKPEQESGPAALRVKYVSSPTAAPAKSDAP